MNRRAYLLAGAWACLALAACGGGASSERPETYQPSIEAPDDREIQESDLVRHAGNWLFVQNPSTGLHVIDVADPDRPEHVGQLGITGQAGEIYVLENHLLVLFEQAQPPCKLPSSETGWFISETSEVVAVGSPTTAPHEVSRLCFPGHVAASRVVGGVLYVVTTYEKFGDAMSWLFSVDVAHPAEMGVVDYRVLDGQSVEVFVDDRAMFITQSAGSGTTTGIRYVDISDPGGVLRERGEIFVDGAPQGRFHMDATEEAFRIVTYAGLREGTHLHVIDIRNPDRLAVLGSYTGLAPNEELWATRFDGDMVYIVTYLRLATQPQDPLWTFSLADPTNPRLLGELEVPGWSTTIFPRGDRLVAVGRGDRGARVAVSLYDVNDPRHPAELRRLEFGEPEATSEANADFRGVTILDEGSFRYRPMIVVPFTNNVWSNGVCRPAHYLQLIDLLPDDVELRGFTGQPGRIRRALPVEDRLYSISDQTVLALEVSDRDRPYPYQVLNIGDRDAPDECTWLENALDFGQVREGDFVDGPFMWACSTSPGAGGGFAGWLFPLICLAVSLRVLRRRSP